MPGAAMLPHCAQPALRPTYRTDVGDMQPGEHWQPAQHQTRTVCEVSTAADVVHSAGVVQTAEPYPYLDVRTAARATAA